MITSFLAPICAEGHAVHIWEHKVIKHPSYYNDDNPLSGNNSTYRTAQNIKDTARRLRSAARGNKQRQQRIRTIEANYLRAVGREPLRPNEAATNNAGAVLRKVRGRVVDYAVLASRSQTYTPSTKAKASVSG